MLCQYQSQEERFESVTFCGILKIVHEWVQSSSSSLVEAGREVVEEVASDSLFSPVAVGSSAFLPLMSFPFMSVSMKALIELKKKDRLLNQGQGAASERRLSLRNAAEKAAASLNRLCIVCHSPFWSMHNLHSLVPRLRESELNLVKKYKEKIK